MRRLEGKVAIVTGGATGIGEAICKRFCVEGAKVIVNGFPEDPVSQVVEEIRKTGGDAHGFVGDVSMDDVAMECVQFAVKTYKKIDILVNNAGVFPVMEMIENFPSDAFDYMVKNNMRSAFLMTKFAMPELQKTRGNIVNAGSESGLIGLGENAVYGGTKGWMHAFTRGIAAEQARHGVRANCVCPGAIDTAWTHKDKGPMTKKHEQMILDGTPLGRRGTPDEIAHAYLFLASDEASYVTGALFSVDGGITIGKGAIGAEADKITKKEPTSELNLQHGKEGATDMLRGTQTNLE